MKKIAFLFIMLLNGTGFIFAQGSQFNLVTDNTWQQKGYSGLNYNPIDWSNLLALGTMQAVTVNPTLTSVCSVTVGSMPGGVITGPTGNNCSIGTVTRIFKKTFDVPFGGPLCDAVLNVRADDLFRVYINGHVVPGNLIFSCNGGTYNSLNGTTSTQIYTIHLTADIIAPGQNTLFIEVINCSTPNLSPNIHYLSASLNIVNHIPNNEAAFNYTIQNGTQQSARLLLTPVINPKAHKIAGIGNLSWTIEQSSSENGPWTLFQHTVTTESTLSANLPNCYFYRITRAITNGCSIATYTIIIFVCEEGFIAGGRDKTSFVAESESPDLRKIFEGENLDLNDFLLARPVDEKSDAGNENELQLREENTVEQSTPGSILVSPNPASDYITIQFNGQVSEETVVYIFSPLGLLQSFNLLNENSRRIDISSLPAGIYFIKIEDGQQQYNSKFMVRK